MAFVQRTVKVALLKCEIAVRAHAAFASIKLLKRRENALIFREFSVSVASFGVIEARLRSSTVEIVQEVLEWAKR
jgi:hypothetical protein